MDNTKLIARLRARYERAAGTDPMLAQAAHALEAAEAELTDLRANPRDEYHTMDELYDYRMLYNALAFNAWAAARTFPVVKSWRHSDGELCFGGGWFIVTATLPTGLVSNHYKAEHWDLFQVDDVWYPPEYDGHTPQDAAERLRSVAAAPVSLEAVKAQTTTEDLRECADYFEHIGSHVGDPPFTQELVVRALRGPRPFGAAASTEGDNRG